VTEAEDAVEQVRTALLAEGFDVERVAEVTPSLEDVFVALVHPDAEQGPS
jgi:hypothetical protein